MATCFHTLLNVWKILNVLEDFTDGGARVHGVAKSWTQLSTHARAHTYTHTPSRAHDGLDQDWLMKVDSQGCWCVGCGEGKKSQQHSRVFGLNNQGWGCHSWWRGKWWDEQRSVFGCKAAGEFWVALRTEDVNLEAVSTWMVFKAKKQLAHQGHEYRWRRRLGDWAWYATVIRW